MPGGKQLQEELAVSPHAFHFPAVLAARRLEQRERQAHQLDIVLERVSHNYPNN